MHRHGYKGRKFGRERDQRRALIKGLADALIIHESIETTLPKAKEIVPYMEKLITKAKAGTLHSRRQVIAGVQTLSSAHKLVDEIAPKLTARNSGYLRIRRSGFRRGDLAPLAKVSFVDDLTSTPVAKSASQESQAPKRKTAPAAKTATTKPVAKKVVKK